MTTAVIVAATAPTASQSQALVSTRVCLQATGRSHTLCGTVCHMLGFAQPWDAL